MLANLVKLIGTPRMWRAARKWHPFSVTSFLMTESLAEVGVDYRTIVDVGANVGQFTAAAKARWPEAKIYPFEPDPEAAEYFRWNHPTVGLKRCAVGNQSGTIDFFPDLADSRASSCIERPGVTPVPVHIDRLDVLLREVELKSPVLLKLDVQGFELAVLEGAPETLAKTTHVVAEVTVPGDLQKIWELLTGAGFIFLKFVGSTPIGGGESQVDVLFARVRLSSKPNTTESADSTVRIFR